MALRNSLKIISQTTPEFSKQWTVAAGAVMTIERGVPTKLSTGGNIVPMVDGDGTTSQRFTGIAKDDSTDVVATAGVVNVWLPVAGMIYAGAAKSAAAADTQAEIDALNGKRVVFDLTSATWTVDSAAADASTNNVVIVGGDFRTSTLNFVVKAGFLDA